MPYPCKPDEIIYIDLLTKTLSIYNSRQESLTWDGTGRFPMNLRFDPGVFSIDEEEFSCLERIVSSNSLLLESVPAERSLIAWNLLGRDMIVSAHSLVAKGSANSVSNGLSRLGLVDALAARIRGRSALADLVARDLEERLFDTIIGLSDRLGSSADRLASSLASVSRVANSVSGVFGRLADAFARLLPLADDQQRHGIAKMLRLLRSLHSESLLAASVSDYSGFLRRLRAGVQIIKGDSTLDPVLKVLLIETLEPLYDNIEEFVERARVAGSSFPSLGKPQCPVQEKTD